MIPKIINKIYLSNNDDFPSIIEPETLKEAHLTWNILNPDYKLRYFNGKRCEEYLLDNFGVEHYNTFKKLVPFSYRCDFFRYCVIYKEGGWYSDWKQELLIPIDDILNDEEKLRIKFIFAYDNGSEYTRHFKCIGTSFFGSVVNNPVLKSAIDKIISNVKEHNYGLTPLDPTGPFVFGQALEVNKECFQENELKIGIFDHCNYYEFDERKIVKHKCDGVRHDQVWDNGNNYAELWGYRAVYL
jgi:mannosyltransferase OCH1-like enzyme